MPFKKRVLAGNWKMNGTSDQLTELDRMAAASPGYTTLTMLLCLPATLIARAHGRLGSGTLELGGQDCHAEGSGAHTGDVSAEMLRDAGAHYVIVGHSERRADHGETSAMVRAKAEAAWRAGITAIICIGETQAEREAGATLNVLAEQLAGSVPLGARATNTIIAYEPVWAIGTGLTPTTSDVARAHAHVRARLQDLIGNDADAVRLLYGGSVKPANAAELMALDHVDGALVGGASLKAEDFLGIADAF